MAASQLTDIEWKIDSMKIYRYPSKAAQKRIEAIVNRGLKFKKKDLYEVTRILENVKKHGDRALINYTNRFDAPGLTAAALKVSSRELGAAAKKVDRGFSRALNRAASHIEAFHRGPWRRSRRPRRGRVPSCCDWREGRRSVGRHRNQGGQSARL